MAQEAPEIEAFIAGIESYDEAGRAVAGENTANGEVPANALPADTGNDFVAGPPAVPSRVVEVRPANVDQPASEGSLNQCEACTTGPGSDYFYDDYQVIDAPVSPDRTWVLGVGVPIFDRQLDGNRLFSFNPADPTQTLTNQNADGGIVGGIDTSLARRSSNGRGFEVRYWGLYPGAETALLGGSPTTAINGLSQINDSGTALSDTFNAADFHALTRDYSFNNVELNLLRNGRSYRPLGRCMMVEWLTGFRYLQFNESLEYAAVAPTNPIIRSALNSSVENSLFGAQFGGRAEWGLFKRLSFSMGGKLGLFNNHAQTNIVATNQLADLSFRRPVVSSGPAAGREFEYGDAKDDLSFVGEFDLGLIYQMTRRSRLRMGYRGLGVTNVVTAESNIPRDFTNPDVLQSANTTADLILRGAYVGAEIGF
jgi:hypothetical protein